MEKLGGLVLPFYNISKAYEDVIKGQKIGNVLINIQSGNLSCWLTTSSQITRPQNHIYPTFHSLLYLFFHIPLKLNNRASDEPNDSKGAILGQYQ